MRAGRFRFNLRRAMVMVVVIGLALAYAARYRICNAIADKHQETLFLGPGVRARSEMERELANYHRTYRDRYRRAAIYPWVRVPGRFVPFDPTGFSTERKIPQGPRREW